MGNCCSSQSDLDHTSQPRPSGHHNRHATQGSQGGNRHGSQGRSSQSQQYELQSTTRQHRQDSRTRTSVCAYSFGLPVSSLHCGLPILVISLIGCLSKPSKHHRSGAKSPVPDTRRRKGVHSHSQTRPAKRQME